MAGPGSFDRFLQFRRRIPQERDAETLQDLICYAVHPHEHTLLTAFVSFFSQYRSR